MKKWLVILSALVRVGLAVSLLPVALSWPPRITYTPELNVTFAPPVISMPPQ